MEIKVHDLDTAGWLEFPFTYNGYEMVSKINPHSPIASRALEVPRTLLDKYNQECMEELVGKSARKEYVECMLVQANKRATYAVVELV